MAAEAGSPPATRRRGASSPSAPESPVPRWFLIGGLALVAVVTVALRVAALTAHLPQLVSADEPTTVDRALRALDGQLVPPGWDWPPGAALLLAGVLRLLVALGGVTVDEQLAYTTGRVVFAGISALVPLATGALAVLVVGPRHRAPVGLGAALLVALSYLAVRHGRTVHPDQLQMLLMLLSVLATLRFDRTRAPRWVLAAAGLAGLAGAAKYLGVVAVVPLAASVLFSADERRVRQLVAAGAATVAGLLVGTLFTPVFDLPGLLSGLGQQFAHQAGGHLGYEAQGPSWWFHLTQSLPGNWGWPVTVVALAGTVWALVAGSRPLRLVTSVLVPLLTFAALSSIAFPHYIAPALPFLAVAGAAFLARVLPQLPVGVGAVLVVALAASLVPTALDDLRLVRAAAAPDTREAAADMVRRLPDDVAVHAERYATVSGGADRETYAWGHEPGVLDCDCVALISSAMEDRFRRRPGQYAEQVAVYDAMRGRGAVLAVVGPDRLLSYRWDLLPQWGLDRIPLVGPVGTVGPQITVVDLRDDGSLAGDSP